MMMISLATDADCCSGFWTLDEVVLCCDSASESNGISITVAAAAPSPADASIMAGSIGVALNNTIGSSVLILGNRLPNATGRRARTDCCAKVAT